MITLRITINFYIKLQNEDFFPFVCTMSKNMAPSVFTNLENIALAEIFTVMWSKTSGLSNKTEENDIQSSEQCLRWFPKAAAIYFCFYWYMSEIQCPQHGK